MRPSYGPCTEETPDPCPACGATVAGDDPVRGVCQARKSGPPPSPTVQLVLIHKETGEVVASTR